MKKPLILAIVGCVVLLFLLGIACFGELFFLDLDRTSGTDAWHRDGPPSKTDMGRLIRGSNYPTSISRVVEIGTASRVNGDSEELIVFCFPTTEVISIKQLLGDGREWTPGFPDGPNWRDQINAQLPPDLQIPPKAPESDFIYVQIELFRCTVIDTIRGISYRVVIQT